MVMKKFDGIMIISDGDATLLNSNREIAPRNIPAIEYFAANGGMFVLATGRPMAGAKHIRSQLPADVPSIYFNGALIYDHSARKVLYSNPLPAGMRDVAAFLVKEFPGLGLECFTYDQAFIIRDGPVTRYHMEILHMEGLPLDASRVPDRGILKMFATGDPALIAASCEALRRNFPGMFHAVPSGENFLEIFSASCDKGSAVAALRKQYPEYRICAVGDNYNDIAMFEQADRVFVPANGVDAAKRLGTVVCSCDDGAIADVVAYLDRE